MGHVLGIVIRKITQNRSSRRWERHGGRGNPGEIRHRKRERRTPGGSLDQGPQGLTCLEATTNAQNGKRLRQLRECRRKPSPDAALLLTSDPHLGVSNTLSIELKHCSNSVHWRQPGRSRTATHRVPTTDCPALNKPANALAFPGSIVAVSSDGDGLPFSVQVAIRSRLRPLNSRFHDVDSE